MDSKTKEEIEEEELREFLKTMPDQKAIDWCGTHSDGIPNVLLLLNLSWKEEDKDFYLQLFREVAQRLAREPEYLREIIRTHFWRHNLIGVISVILLEDKAYCADLTASFETPNFVSPQIAVALGLVCPEEAVTQFERVVKQAAPLIDPVTSKTVFSPDTFSKRILAAHTVLSKLDPKLAKELAGSEIFQLHQENSDGKTGASVAEHHWNFWINVISNPPQISKSESWKTFFNKSFFKKLP